MNSKAGRPGRGKVWTAFAGAIFAAGGYGAMVEAAVVSGQVLDADRVRALQGAQVLIVELGRTAEAGPDGRYRFADVAPGRYTLRVSYVGAQREERRIEVVGDDPVALDIALSAVGDSVLLDDMLVVGQRANLSSSLSRQRAADGVESVLTRDAIGQFPDQNVAESLRRVPGINVLNDQGEGRFVSIRGLSPDLNATSLNGVRVPAPESDVRGVALDVLPAELIESIEVKKSLTPEMDADTLGASIEINTTSALDREEPFLGVTLEGSYNDLRDEWSPKGAIDFSRRINERFGVAGGLSYYDREFSTDNVEADGWDTSDDGVVYADTIEYRDYDVTRERIGGSLSLDYRLNDMTTLYARGVHSRFTDHEYRGALIFEFDEAPSAGDGSSAQFDSGDGEISLERHLKDREEVQEITSLSTGGRSFAGSWTFDYQLAWSSAEEQERGSLDPQAFTAAFEDPGALGVRFDYADFALPRYTITQGADRFYDPSTYAFDSLERTTRSDAQDEEVSARLDIARAFALTQGSAELKFGIKARSREKTYDGELDIFDGYAGEGDYTLADVAASQSYGLYPISPLPGRSASSFFRNNIGDFEIDPLESAFESAVEDYAAEEDINAAYLQGRFDRGGLSVIGGVRVEDTDTTLTGNETELLEEGTVLDGVTLDEDTLVVTPVRHQRDDTMWLPSVTLRYETPRDVVVRAAAYRSLLRPGFAEMAPRFIIEESEDDGREGEFGNPDLRPYEAWNYDVGAEWYFSPNAVLQAGYFHKDIDDFIVYAEFEDGSFNGVDYAEAVIPINGESATVDGLEFGYQQSLQMLPAPLNGLLLGFNYTWTDAEGEAQGRSVPLPAASENTWNATLGYELAGVSLRLAAAYRDRYLDELGGDAEEDRYVEDHLQLDLSAKVRLTEQWQVFAEFINLTDEPYVAYQRGPEGKRLLQYEAYSFTAKLGVKATF